MVVLQLQTRTDHYAGEISLPFWHGIDVTSADCGTNCERWVSGSSGFWLVQAFVVSHW